MFHSTTPRKRLRSVHEALFVLEKNAKNIGSSNKSPHGIQEHKDAMQVISALASSKGKKELGDSTIIESLVQLLDPCESSPLEMMAKIDIMEFKVATLNLLTNLISSTEASLKLSKLNIALMLTNMWKQYSDLPVLEASKSFLVKLYEVTPFDRIEIEANDKLLIATLKLVRKLNRLNYPKATLCNSDLVHIMLTMYKDSKRRAFIAEKGKLYAYREAMVIHLLKSLGCPYCKHLPKPCDTLKLLSEEKENCEIIVSNDGISKICLKLRQKSTKFSEKVALVEILKHILNSDKTEASISLYEDILSKGGVKNLDCFLVKMKSNKKFTVRMMKEQKMQRNLIKTKARMKIYQISTESGNQVVKKHVKKPPRELSGEFEV